MRRVRETTGNLSEHVEMLLAAALEAEMAKRSAADALLAETLAYWNEFDAEHGSFADEFSSLAASMTHAAGSSSPWSS